MSTSRAVLANATRTPFGKNRGALSAIRPDDLFAATLRTLVERTPGLDPADIEDVIAGDTNGAGEDNRNVARMSLLLAGLPQTIPGVTLNRLCGSGAEAIVQASRAIRCGDAEIMIAGGVETMSRAPWIVERSQEKGAPALTPESVAHQSVVGWRLINPKMKADWTISLGETSQRVADRLGIGRTEQDEWSVRSHLRAHAAWEAGLHDHVFEINGLSRDESIRPNTTMETLGALDSAFTPGGSGTAGNSSPVTDGAAASLITSEAAAKSLGLEPMAYILSSAVTALAPDELTLAPVPAIHRALARAGKSIKDVKVWEINEAFASMVLTVLHEIPEINRDLVNPHGGAIAIGHPVGASANRVVMELARELRRRGGGIGVVAACIGVGLGIALVIEA
jgi:acetyl-CoA acyltransferase